MAANFPPGGMRAALSFVCLYELVWLLLFVETTLNDVDDVVVAVCIS